MFSSRRWITALLTVCVVAVAASPAAAACTRILWNDNGLAVVVARTMDWPESTEPVLTVLPRGLSHDGGMSGPVRVVAENPAIWTSRYGSLVTTVYGVGAVDGFNEKGLGIHLLYLNATELEPRNADIPGLSIGLWGQYVLDNAASVTEALDVLRGVQLVMAEANGHAATVHLVMEDASGDSAIIEYIDGQAVIHHSRDYRVVTNDPSYDEQLALLSRMDFSHPSSDTPLPGNVKPTDRFQRASYFLDLLPSPADEQEAVAGILSIARNVSVPFGAPYKGFGIYNTEYRTAMNLTDLRYYFELTTNPNVIWVTLPTFDLSPGAPVMTLDPHNRALVGNVTGAFVRAAAPY